MTKPHLSCEQQDYIEIACLYRYRVRIRLADGNKLVGQAIDTLTTAEKKEYLII